MEAERNHVLRGKAYSYMLTAAEKPGEKKREMRPLGLAAPPPVFTRERMTSGKRPEALMGEGSEQNEI